LITISNRVLIFLFAVLFFLAAGYFAYWQNTAYLIAPFILLTGILLIQYPQYLIYGLAISIPWSIEYHFDGNFSTDLPDEPLMLLSSIAVLCLIFFYWKKINWKKLHPILLIIALEFLWIVFTAITSTDFTLSLKYSLAKGWYLLAFVGLPLFLFQNGKILKRSAVLLLSSMLIFMFVALIRHSQYLWSFGKVNDALKPFFLNHVNYSALLVFMVPIEIACLQLTASKKLKTFITVLVFLTIAALYLSYSRGAWLALLTGIIAYWLLKKKVLFISFLLFIFVSVGVVFWLKTNDRFLNYSNDYKTTIFHSNFREHLIATYKLKDLSDAERFYRWVAGVRMIKDNWQTGIGPSTFYHQYKSYTLPAFKTYVSANKEQSTVHNYFLLVLIEQGVIGFLLFVALLASFFWNAQKIYERTQEKFWKVTIAAISSIMVMQCFVNFLSDMIETDKIGSVFYWCIAVLIIADFKTRKKSNLSTNIQSIS